MTLRRLLRLISLLALGIASLAAGPLSAATIGIIGTGEVAGALGPAFAAQGHTIVYGSREPERDDVQALVARTGGDASATDQAGAATRADIVVLAVPWNVVEAVVENLGDLTDKIIIDPTNPRIVGPDGLRDFAVPTSNAELVQTMAPRAFVVKALNTMNWRTMVDPLATGGAVSVPMVGNDTDAKAVVAGLIEGMGLEPIDLGPVRYARVVEGMYLLWGNANTLGSPFNYHLRRAEPN